MDRRGEVSREDSNERVRAGVELLMATADIMIHDIPTAELSVKTHPRYDSIRTLQRIWR
jgi:hypothetical protein